jgi:hypothetical protein
MNKRQDTLFNFGVKKSHIESICETTNSDSSTSSLQSDLEDIQKKVKLPAHRSTRKYMDSYLKFRMTLTNCHDLNVSFVLLFWEMKPSRLTQHLDTKQSDLVNKTVEFFLRKREALKTEKKMISQASTTDTSLLTGILFNIITDS